MREDLRQAQTYLFPTPQPMRSRAGLVVVAAVLTGVISAGVCVAAILAPAPAAVVPLVVAITVGCPVFASWEVPIALASLRASRGGGQAVASFQRTLEQLPETEHPLGL